MKNNFFLEHKKGLLIGGGALFVIIIIFFVVFFIVPSFGGDVYGNRLDGIKSHKISNSNINEIKETVKDNEGVKEITYNREGRILNFIITFEDGYNIDSAKNVANKVIEKISEKNLKYYDVQIYLDSKSNGFPTIGYHSKGSENILWSYVGDSNES